jgi:hypothetical protein
MAAFYAELCFMKMRFNERQFGDAVGRLLLRTKYGGLLKTGGTHRQVSPGSQLDRETKLMHFVPP